MEIVISSLMEGKPPLKSMCVTAAQEIITWDCQFRQPQRSI